MARAVHLKNKVREKRSETRSAVYVRRAPFLISYWQDNQLIFENYLTRKKVAASAEVAAVLDFFGDWTTIEKIAERWPEYSAGSLLKTVSRLLRETMLEGAQRKNPRADERQRALRKWRAWNPAASFFHLSTKDIYADEVTAEEIAYVEQLAKTHVVPKPLKAYPRAKVIPLEKAEIAAEFPRVLRERRTWREFSHQVVTRESLGTLLDLSFGVQAWEEVPTIGRLAQKTSPSGGALHPSEAYVMAETGGRRAAGDLSLRCGRTPATTDSRGDDRGGDAEIFGRAMVVPGCGVCGVFDRGVWTHAMEVRLRQGLPGDPH